MPLTARLPLHRLFLARRPAIFINHARVAWSIFGRPCSCTATLSAEHGDATKSAVAKSLETTDSGIPQPTADHRDLAVKQDLFTTSAYSPGSPLFLPNGADMLNKLSACLRAQYPQFGFREVISPNIYKKSLWEKSGHWDKYAKDMFEVRGRGATGEKADAEIGENEAFGLKPMNCPGHCLLFASETRSYRDLPIRYADFSSLHRNEISGALSGLTRVRRFHQDDGHIFCRPSQIEDEIKQTMAFIDLVYRKIFHLGLYRLVLSTRPEDYIGEISEWESAEEQLKVALDHSGLDWKLNEGDGAFYGPKIDIILKDSDGKEHQTATIQLDFQLPQRFKLTYDEESGSETPVMIHRAVLGSLERFLALLIEHYNGCYPFWISPRPLAILSVAQSQGELTAVESARQLLSGMSEKVEIGSFSKAPILRPLIHTDIDTSARSLSKKVREANTKGYNFVAVIGPNDVKENTISLMVSRTRNRPETLDFIDFMKQRYNLPESQGNLKLTARQTRQIFEHLQDNYL